MIAGFYQKLTWATSAGRTIASPNNSRFGNAYKTCATISNTSAKRRFREHLNVEARFEELLRPRVKHRRTAASREYVPQSLADLCRQATRIRETRQNSRASKRPTVQGMLTNVFHKLRANGTDAPAWKNEAPMLRFSRLNAIAGQTIRTPSMRILGNVHPFKMRRPRHCLRATGRGHASRTVQLETPCSRHFRGRAGLPDRRLVRSVTAGLLSALVVLACLAYRIYIEQLFLARAPGRGIPGGSVSSCSDRCSPASAGACPPQC